MEKNIWVHKVLIFLIITAFCSLAFMPMVRAEPQTKYPLPPPLSTDIIIEESIFRRMSIRNYTEEPVTDEELSTVLWAAYGYLEDGNRTVPGINGVYGAVIYVLKEDAVYTYNPLNHSLVFYKSGDYRQIVGWQYKAPIQLGLVWDKSINGDENLTGAEIGQIGQNIQFMANALDLGTVVTGEIPSPINKIGLPPHHVGRIVMPLGHPTKPYDFVHLPMSISFMPRVKSSEMNLSYALQERKEATSWSDSLSKQEQAQMIWSSYGYSYFFDKSKSDNNYIKRHRTVPSAHGYYPLRMYVVTESGVYRYIPGIYNPLYGALRFIWILPVVTFLVKIAQGDKREVVAQASQPFVASAPLLIIAVLDIGETIRTDDFSGDTYRWLWYYEAGAAAHNVLLDGAAWGLSGTIVTPTDPAALRSLLHVNESYVPLLIIPIGK